MAPKRKIEEQAVAGEEEVAKPTRTRQRKTYTPDPAFKRVTRGTAGGKKPRGTAAVAEVKPAKKKKKEAVARKSAETPKTDAANGDAADEKQGQAEENKTGKTVVVEYCKQCNSFKTRAFQVKEGLEKLVTGVTVLLNPDKPRRGCFEIREDGGETFISLLDMKRPFKPMKDLDMEDVISEIAEKINC